MPEYDLLVSVLDADCEEPLAALLHESEPDTVRLGGPGHGVLAGAVFAVILAAAWTHCREITLVATLEPQNVLHARVSADG
jgi:hypothetical protein